MRIFIPAVIFLIIAAGCAVEKAPSGGPPDKTPPEIVKSEPESGTINFKGNEIKIEFSKWMNRSSVTQSIFISPEIKTEYNWSGKDLYIEFKEDLDTGTTYALTIGTDFKDKNNNPPENAFTLIFSTGSKIDSGSIKGKIYTEDPSGAFIFAYRLNGIDPDTLNPSTTPPDYRTQTGTDSTFNIKALSNGTYRLIALRDKFNNKIYDFGIDDFGSAEMDFEVTQEKPAYAKLKMGPPVDIAGPALLNAEPVFSTRVRAIFSEPLDTSTVSADSFVLRDTMRIERIAVKSVFIEPGSMSKVSVITEKLPSESGKWILKALSGETGIRDTSGNVIRDSVSEAKFKPLTDRDTLLPRIVELPFSDSTQGIDTDAEFRIVFNDAAGLASDTSLSVTGEEGRIDVSYDTLTANILKISPDSALKNIQWYQLDIAEGAFVSHRLIAFPDSVISLRFETIDKRGYPSVSGEFHDTSKTEDNYVIQLKETEGKYYFQKTIENNSEWEFGAIPPGKYRIDLFIDTNGDEEYFYGMPYPFEFAEPFAIVGRIIELKPRWDVEDVIINIPVKEALKKIDDSDKGKEEIPPEEENGNPEE